MDIGPLVLFPLAGVCALIWWLVTRSGVGTALGPTFARIAERATRHQHPED